MSLIIKEGPPRQVPTYRDVFHVGRAGRDHTDCILISGSGANAEQETLYVQVDLSRPGQRVAYDAVRAALAALINPEQAEAEFWAEKRSEFNNNMEGLRKLNESLVERIAGQSALLSKRAEVSPDVQKVLTQLFDACVAVVAEWRTGPAGDRSAGVSQAMDAIDAAEKLSKTYAMANGSTLVVDPAPEDPVRGPNVQNVSPGRAGDLASILAQPVQHNADLAQAELALAQLVAEGQAAGDYDDPPGPRPAAEPTTHSWTAGVQFGLSCHPGSPGEIKILKNGEQVLGARGLLVQTLQLTINAEDLAPKIVLEIIPFQVDALIEGGHIHVVKGKPVEVQKWPREGSIASRIFQRPPEGE